MVIYWKKLIIYLFFFVLVIVLMDNAFAAEGELIKTITNKFESITGNWHENLRPATIGLFWILATISFTYTAITMTIRGADFTDIMLELVKMILVFGLWIYIIENSIDIVNSIINSLTQAANIASGVSSDVSPGSIINNGVTLATNIIDQSGFFDAPIYGILALVALIAYLFIAATIFVVLVESYIVTGAGIILLGFSGSPWTSDIAKKYLIFSFSIGIKLFATIIVARFGEELVRDQLTTSSAIKQIFAVTGVLCMIAYLTNRIPAMAQSMINGASSSGPNDVKGMAASAGKAAAAGVLASAGATAALYQAGKGAMSEMKGSSSMNSALSSTTQTDSTNSTPANANDNDRSAIPQALSSGSSNFGGSSSASVGSSESTENNPNASDNSNRSSEKEQSNLSSDGGSSLGAGSSSSATITPAQQSRAAAAAAKMNHYAKTADKAVQNSPQFLRQTAKNLAKGSVSAIGENLTKHKAFDTAKKIQEQNISKKINQLGEDK